MSRIPSFVLKRNRRDSYAEEQARGYNAVGHGQYMLDRMEGQEPISIDLRAFLRENTNLTPADRRRIRELGAGQAMQVPGFEEGQTFVLGCLVPGNAL